MKIIEENYYYVDKTKFIEDIINNGAQVKLFTRPRRFGKTLNMSTLKYFFDVRGREKNRELFNNLYIQNSPVFSEQGKYPVIFISMKGIADNYYNQPIILLIDEYDSIIINAYENGYYKEMINFLKGFYGDVLKTNNYLKMGILTGIIRIAQI